MILVNGGDQQTSVEKNHEHKDQSPIDIIVDETKMVQVPPLEYINMDIFEECEVIITNNGSTGTINISLYDYASRLSQRRDREH